MSEAKLNDELIQMTQEGYDKLMSELIRLRSEERYKIAKRIEEARSFGDLSENAEYAAAKEDQSKLEGKIQNLEYQLNRAKVVDSSKLDGSVVTVGTIVTLVDMTHNNQEFVYTIVSSEEADPKQGLISSASPVGRAILNHRKNDIVTVKVPKGLRKLKLKKIAVA